jgi:hypothetical protein
VLRAAKALLILVGLALGGCTRASASPAPVTITIDCRAPGHRISPLIYGVAIPDNRDPARALPWELGATARRWGGNSSSRYNWELGNAWNTANDWFFRNVDYGIGSWSDFLEENRAHGLASALTVPLLGQVAKDTSSRSYPVALLGRQHAMDPEQKSGDGIALDGKPLAPQSTSVAAPPEMIARWAAAVRARGGVQQYILDNEPMLWHETHRDVHPQPVGYDELLDRTLRYGAAIRKADPHAVIAGPALWGWPAYFYSAIDAKSGFRSHPDRRAHGDLPLLVWYLQQVKAAERKSGVHILDLLDVHFYPQAGGLGTGKEGSVDARTAALRVRSVRGLWDPDYRDESFIEQPIRLLPRLREWIDANDPGLGISIGEYNFGAEQHISGGLALAEALGRFAQFEVTSAFYWTAPPRDSPAYWAFRAFRNYDGHDGHFLELFAGAASLDRLSLFASRDAGATRAIVVAVNSRDTAAAATVELRNCGERGPSAQFTYTAGSTGLIRHDLHGETATLPPMSITALEVQLAPAPSR